MDLSPKQIVNELNKYIIGVIPPLVSLLTAANRVFLRKETLLET